MMKSVCVLISSTVAISSHIFPKVVFEEGFIGFILEAIMIDKNHNTI